MQLVVDNGNLVFLATFAQGISFPVVAVALRRARRARQELLRVFFVPSNNKVHGSLCTLKMLRSVKRWTVKAFLPLRFLVCACRVPAHDDKLQWLRATTHTHRRYNDNILQPSCQQTSQLRRFPSVVCNITIITCFWRAK